MTSAFRTLAAIVVSGPLLAGCAINLDAEKVTHTDEHRFEVTGTPDLVLSTFDGSIRIEASDDPDVVVTIRKRGEDIETARALPVRVHQEGNRITVDVPQPEQRRSVGVNVGRSAALDVRVPRTADVQARTGDGAIDVTGVTGRVELRTGDGSIRTTGVQGDVSASTGDGSITVEQAGGRLDLHSGDGSLSVQGTFERVKLHTGDGSIAMRAAAGSRLAGDWEITTGDGSVTVELPASLDAEIDVHTGDGRISVDGLPLEERTRAERDLRGRLGQGGSTLKVRSGDGAITLRASASSS